MCTIWSKYISSQCLPDFRVPGDGTPTEQRILLSCAARNIGRRDSVLLLFLQPPEATGQLTISHKKQKCGEDGERERCLRTAEHIELSM